MIRIGEIRVPEGADTGHIKAKAAHMLRLKSDDIKEMRILKQSKDARRKNNILEVYTVAVGVEGEKGILKRCSGKNISRFEEEIYRFPRHGIEKSIYRPVIAGFGPAGIFASLILAHEGYRPVVFERGKNIEDRKRDVEHFFDTGVLDPASNVQFGEGGAGTFSDGKLSTGIKDREGRKKFVLDTFVRHGADRSILSDSHPHIGTDRLMKMIPSIRREIEELGGEIRFSHTVKDIKISDGAISGIRIAGENDEVTECDSLFLCIGHSARDTFGMLKDLGAEMEAKSFAVGLRAEHTRRMIDEALKRDKADYKLTYHCRDGRGVYSFCMCPGGYVVNSSSEEGYLTVNGMSFSGRDGVNSNAAIVCTVSPDDFRDFGDDALSGMRFQRELEKKAYDECSGAIPYQRYADFKAGIKSSAFGYIKPCARGRSGMGNIRNILPPYITDDIIEAMQEFGKRIEGYDSDDVLIAGAEVRTSSPVRILRGDNMQSVNIRGLYPVGEGAGYAGGIMSAAIDGMKAAESYIRVKESIQGKR